MVNLRAAVIAGWTIFAVCTLGSICVVAYLVYDWRKNAKLKKQQDIELQEKQAEDEKQSQNIERPISFIDPFSMRGVITDKAPTSEPVSFAQNPPKHHKQAMMSVALQSEADDDSTRTKSLDLEPPRRINTAEIRDSLDLSSLCSTPFSETFPQNWGKVVE